MFRRIRKIKIDQKIILKLLNDSLFILSAFFLLALIADGLLPGIVSSHFGFYKIVLLIFANILGINYLAKKLDITFTQRLTKKTIIPMVIISALLIFNSLFGMNIFLSLITIVIIFAIGFFLYREVFGPTN